MNRASAESGLVTRGVAPLFKEDLLHVLEHTRGLWDEFQGRSIFITGGTGFFGMWMVESFLFINRALSLNATICVLTRDPEGYRNKAPHLVDDPALSMLRGDVRNFEFPLGSRFDCIVHAGTTSSAPVDPMEMFSTIVDGTKRVLEFGRCVGARQFLFVSSGAVYGKQPTEITHISEEYVGGPDVLEPHSAYGEGKRAGELLCAMSANEVMECKIARCFAFVGPHLPLDAHFAIGNFIRDAMSGGPIRIGGDGTPMRSYLYAADLAVWLWTILFRGKKNQAYNVGAQEDLSIKQIAEQVASVLNTNLEIQIAQPVMNPMKPSRYVPNTNRALRELGLTPRVGLQEAIHRSASWVKSRV
jgi:nucleoside-diphosphate-sugar epimerase